MSQHYDIVICGGGLVGLTLANLLDDERFSILLLDAAKAPTRPQATQVPTSRDSQLESGFTPRISVFNASSMDLLQRCEIPLPRGCEFSEMKIWDGDGSAEISFHAQDVGADCLGVVIENQAVVYGLYQRLIEANRVTLSYDQIVADTQDDEFGTRLTLENGDECTAGLVVGADGGESTIRHLSGIKSAGWKYDETALVCTIETEAPHQSIPRQWFTPEGPLAFLPLCEPNLMSIVWSHKEAASLLELNERAFCERLSEASESQSGRVVAVDQRFSFPLRQRHAIQYGKPGVVLIGDAAHTIHPLAGQGANLGLSDAEVLARELLQTLLSDEEPGDARLLRRFAAARQPQNLAIGAAMELFKHSYRSNIPLVRWLRNEAMRFTDQNVQIKRLMMKLAAGQL